MYIEQKAYANEHTGKVRAVNSFKDPHLEINQQTLRRDPTQNLVRYNRHAEGCQVQQSRPRTNATELACDDDGEQKAPNSELNETG